MAVQNIETLKASMCGKKLGYSSKQIAKWACKKFMAWGGHPKHSYLCPFCSTETDQRWHIGESKLLKVKHDPSIYEKCKAAARAV